MSGTTQRVNDMYQRRCLEEQWIDQNAKGFSEHVGGGGFGSVFRCPQEHLVVKLLRKDDREGLEREVKACLLLEVEGVGGVPSVVGWTDAWWGEGSGCGIVFQDVGSSSLGRMVRTGGIPRSMLKDTAGKLIFTVLEIHVLAGITHGDICPDNVVTDVDEESGEITTTLVDFGGAVQGKVGERAEMPRAYRTRYQCPLMECREVEGSTGAAGVRGWIHDGKHNGLRTDLYAAGKTIALCGGWTVEHELEGSPHVDDADLFSFIKRIVSSSAADRLDANGVLHNCFFKKWMKENSPAILKRLQEAVARVNSPSAAAPRRGTGAARPPSRHSGSKSSCPPTVFPTPREGRAFIPGELALVARVPVPGRRLRLLGSGDGSLSSSSSSIPSSGSWHQPISRTAESGAKRRYASSRDPVQDSSEAASNSGGADRKRALGHAEAIAPQEPCAKKAKAVGSRTFRGKGTHRTMQFEIAESRRCGWSPSMQKERGGRRGNARRGANVRSGRGRSESRNARASKSRGNVRFSRGEDGSG